MITFNVHTTQSFGLSTKWHHCQKITRKQDVRYKWHALESDFIQAMHSLVVLHPISGHGLMDEDQPRTDGLPAIIVVDDFGVSEAVKDWPQTDGLPATPGVKNCDLSESDEDRTWTDGFASYSRSRQFWRFRGG